jgi:mannose-6-phosphate isomerase-like protein (cupin superfamily)
MFLIVRSSVERRSPLIRNLVETLWYDARRRRQNCDGDGELGHPCGSTKSSRRSAIVRRPLHQFDRRCLMSMTRREICFLLSGLVLPAAVELPAFAAEEGSLPSAAFQFDQLPMHISNNHAEVRLIIRGKLATGEGVEVHETTLPPGAAPTVSTHHHPHSEMWLLREGTIELTVNGKIYRLQPGSLGFVRSNEEHGIKNVGSTPATYFVVAVGPGAELQT